MTKQFYWVIQESYQANEYEKWQDKELTTAGLYTDSESCLNRIKTLASEARSNRRFRVRKVTVDDTGVTAVRGRPAQWIQGEKPCLPYVTFFNQPKGD